MFGRPQAPQKNWDDMYFYEKLHHLVDHTADFVISKANWWLPSVGVGMVMSLFILGGPEGPIQGVSMAYPTLTPVTPTPSFAFPERPAGGAGAPEEEEL